MDSYGGFLTFRCHVRGPHKKDYSIWGFVLGTLDRGNYHIQVDSTLPNGIWQCARDRLKTSDQDEGFRVLNPKP